MIKKRIPTRLDEFEYREELFARLRSLTRTALIFGVLTYVVGYALPPFLESTRRFLVLAYSVLLVFLAYFSNLAYIQKLNSYSYKQADAFRVINFWSLFEAIFFGVSLNLLSFQLGGDRVFSAGDFLGLFAFVLFFAVLTIVLQDKIWRLHIGQIFTDFRRILEEQDSKKAQGLFAELYDLNISGSGQVSDKPASARYLFTRALATRVLYLIIAAVLAVIQFIL